MFSSVPLPVKYATFVEFKDIAACSPIKIDVLEKHCLIFRFKMYVKQEAIIKQAASNVIRLHGVISHHCCKNFISYICNLVLQQYYDSDGEKE
jgi:hypothetical protein